MKSKKTKMKADFIAPKEKYKAEPSAKKGSSKSSKPVKHAKPQTAKKKGKKSGDASLSFYKSKGLKFGG